MTKTILSSITALSLIFASVTSVYAISETGTDTSSTAVSTILPYSYTVSVPLNTTVGGVADIQCTSNDTEYNKAVVVRIGGLDASNKLVLNRVDDSGNVISGGLASTTTANIEYTDTSSNIKPVKNNDIIAYFANGSETNLAGSPLRISEDLKGLAGRYSGSLNFTVSYELNPSLIVTASETFFDVTAGGALSLKPEYQSGGASNSSIPDILVIPSSVGGITVSSIANNAFENNMHINNVILPDTVTSIGSGAFKSSSLKYIYIPYGVTGIGPSAFYATSISSINIPNSVVTIATLAFAGNGNLKTINVPNSVKTIGVNAFAFTNLDRLTLDAVGGSITGYPWGSTAVTTQWLR